MEFLRHRRLIEICISLSPKGRRKERYIGRKRGDSERERKVERDRDRNRKRERQRDREIER